MGRISKSLEEEGWYTILHYVFFQFCMTNYKIITEIIQDK